jgi:predicted negative regulator of RcsB-dependent stress response
VERQPQRRNEFGGGCVEEYLSEKEQWEWVKGQVRENGPAVLVAIALTVAAVFGWRWWQGHQDAGRLAAGEKYMQMADALDKNDRAKALAIVADLERTAPNSPYTDQAKLLAARVCVDQNDLARAAELLADVAGHSKDRELTLVARLRLARIQVAQGKPDAALATLGDVAAVGSFAPAYYEARGDAYYAKGDKVAALGEWRSAKGAGEGADAPLLDLKIADVSAGSPAPPRGPIAKASAPTAGK